MSEQIIVATDGSALKNPHGPAGWAWVIDKYRWNSGGFPKASNQVAEMYAILMAMTQIPVEIPIKIQTDSQFCLSMLGNGSKPGWMHSWKPRPGKPTWSKSDGKEPSNLKLVQALDAAMTRRVARKTIEIEWVRGHADHPLNTVADKLCTRVTAAIKTGKEAPVGPGWHLKVPTGASKPVATPAAVRITPVTPKRSASVIRPQFSTKVNKCPSCDGPINPYSLECRCSR